ncbi:MAG: hypothetical protein II564_07010, partial [Oscillospiraceae bacterium]|nr:hypothetical protein [Oscillospiraceae bacterium]
LLSFGIRMSSLWPIIQLPDRTSILPQEAFFIAKALLNSRHSREFSLTNKMIKAFGSSEPKAFHYLFE